MRNAPISSHSKVTTYGKSLAEEESFHEHVVERRSRSRWARAKRRFGRSGQTAGRAYETNRPILDRCLAIGGQVEAAPPKGSGLVESCLRSKIQTPALGLFARSGRLED